MNRAIVVWLVLICLLLNKSAVAEEKLQAVPYFIRATTRARLVGREAVYRDLGLTEEQIQAVRKIVQAQRPENTSVLEKQLAAYSKGALTPSQWARLEEIYVQARGAESLFDAPIATNVGLSDDQKAKLADARLKYIKECTALAEAYKEIQTMDRAQRRDLVLYLVEQRQLVVADFDDVAMSILTSEQRDQFKKLRGKLIDFSHEKALSP
jgi:Spy/CpxP family protein refolding chaperone